MPVRPDLPARCVVLTAAAALTLLTGAAAAADMVAAPTPGTVVTLPEQARGVILTCGGKSYTLDLAGAGQVVVGHPITVDRKTHVPVTTEVEELIGHSPELGEVTVAERKPEVGDLTTGKAGIHKMPVDLTFTIQNDPCRSATSPARRGPLTLTTKDPAELIGKLTRFPPQGDLYKLQNPVDLVVPGDHGATIAKLDKFPVKVGGL